MVLSCVLVMAGFTCRDSGPDPPPPPARPDASPVATPAGVCARVEGDGLFTPLDLQLAAGLPVTRADAGRKALRVTRRRTVSNTTREITFGCYHPPPSLASEASPPPAPWPAWRVDFRGIFRLHGRCVRGWQIVLDAETGKLLSSGTRNRPIRCDAEPPSGGIP